MQQPKRITTPFTEAQARMLRAGDTALVSGIIYTGRDAAHQRLIELLNAGKPLPCDLRDQMLYYFGPTPTRPGEVIGAAGPTTSYRMDAYTPQLLAATGLRAMIGKGSRSLAVVEAIKAHGCCYFAAIGGAGALLASRVKRCEIIAYPELQSEAIHRLEVVDFPVVVVLDCDGNDLYHLGRRNYLNFIGASTREDAK